MLRLSDAAARLGVAPSTLRAFADRGLIPFREMPNRERRFEEAAVEAFRQSGPAEAKPARVEPSAAPASRPRWHEVPPWERGAAAAEAEIRVAKAQREIAQLAAEDEARTAQAEAERQAAEVERQAAEAALKESERQAELQRQRDASARWAETITKTGEAILAVMARRDEEIARERKRWLDWEKQRPARAAAAAEDAELARMESAYQSRKAIRELPGLVRALKR